MLNNKAKTKWGEKIKKELNEYRFEANDIIEKEIFVA